MTWSALSPACLAMDSPRSSLPTSCGRWASLLMAKLAPALAATRTNSAVMCPWEQLISRAVSRAAAALASSAVSMGSWRPGWVTMSTS